MCHTLSGTHPFAEISQIEVITMILVDCERPSIPPHVDVDPQHPVLKQMIQKLWAEDPLERDGFPAIVDRLSKHVTDPNVKRAVELAKRNSLPKQMSPLADAQGISTLWLLCLGRLRLLCWL